MPLVRSRMAKKGEKNKKLERLEGRKLGVCGKEAIAFFAKF